MTDDYSEKVDDFESPFDLSFKSASRSGSPSDIVSQYSRMVLKSWLQVSKQVHSTRGSGCARDRSASVTNRFCFSEDSDEQ